MTINTTRISAERNAQSSGHVYQSHKAKTRINTRLMNCFRVDALFAIQLFFIQGLEKRPIKRPRTIENIVDTLTDLLEEFKKTEQHIFTNTSRLLPINVHSEFDGSLV